MKLVGHRAVLGRTVAEALPDAIEQGYGELLDNVYISGVAFSATGAKFAVQASTGGGIDERWLDFVYQPIKDSHGTVSGIFVEGVDVPERRSAEVALRDSEERFRLAVQSSSLGTWDADLAGNAIYAVSHRVLRRDGSVRWINASGRVTRIARPGGTDQFRFVGVLADVTERQQLLEALRDADRRKDEFLATLAHELRNPLAPIRTAAHLLAKPDLSPDRIAWCSNIIARQTASMALLLDDLLEVWRISSGKVTLRVAPVDIRELVDNAVETSRPLIDARRHALRVVVPDGLPDLSVDPLRIAQILTNLLTNAAKYTDTDGHLALEVRSLPGRMEFDIADDGIGLDASTLEHVFEMFSQVSASRDRAQGGLGIGLSLSQGLAALHGGTLQAYSEGVGRGSTCRLTLPLARDEIAR